MLELEPQPAQEQDSLSFFERYERIVVASSVIAALVAAVTFVAYLLVGPTRFEERLGPIGYALLVQLGGGISVGLIGGALHRIATSPAKMVAVGLTAMLPYSIMAGRLVLGPFSEWSTRELVVVIVVVAGFGGYGGLLLWREIHPAK